MRRSRLVLPDTPLHIVRRGNNRQPCFFAAVDAQVYLHLLRDHAGWAGCRIHAYVLMSNHVHLLLSVADAASPGLLMKGVAQCYTQYVNRRYGRSGTLWEGRYKSCLIQDEKYLLTCQRYIELNPVRAGRAGKAADYRWSSHRCNAQGGADALVSAHPLYLALGPTPEARQSAYRALFRETYDAALDDHFRDATNGNFACGDQVFLRRVAAALGKRVSPGQSGRPKKQDSR